MSDSKLKNKRALVTGANRGIGRSIVEKLVNAGARVIVHGRSPESLEKMIEDFPGITVEIADLSDQDQVIGLAHNALKHFDGIDILINNAGIDLSGNVIDLDISDFNNIMTVNLNAVFILSKIIGKAMINQSDGYIINIGSGASTTPIRGMATYCASKHALLGFSESLALEMRSYGVKVTILMPGSTATGFGGGSAEMRLEKKPGILHPEDVAEVVMNLLYQQKRAWTSQVNLRPLDPEQPF